MFTAKFRKAKFRSTTKLTSFFVDWLFFFFLSLFLIEVYLIYNVVLVLDVQQSDSITHICVYIFLRFFSLLNYYKVLSGVPYDID